MRPVILWFRRDLRLSDNRALHAAVGTGAPIVPVFIWQPEEEAARPPGQAGRWWLGKSLEALDVRLRDLGSRLIVRKDPCRKALSALADETGAETVFWNRAYEPAIVERDETLAETLRADGLGVEVSLGNLMVEPWDIATQQGTPYQVFTPYYKRCLESFAPGDPLPAPKSLSAPENWPDTVSIESLEPTGADNAEQLAEEWTPGEDGAQQCLQTFLDDALADYDSDRDVPGIRGTSRLSPYLHWGGVSVRQVWAAVEQHAQGASGGEEGAEAFLRQLFWREFSYHVLYHHPEMPLKPLRDKFRHFAWRNDEDAVNRWQQGMTGYPYIDAGMRELLATGWMHNRVRMAVASFLTKDLLIPWQEGEQWFWDRLVDADLANNTFGWQWVAGCGADAAPYFRVFNPVTQGNKFDPDGVYVRQWVPELEDMPNEHLFAPWEAPQQVLEEAGVKLGETYPRPIVDHKAARKNALAAYEAIKGD